MKEIKGTPSQGLFGATLGFFIGSVANSESQEVTV